MSPMARRGSWARRIGLPYVVLVLAAAGAALVWADYRREEAVLLEKGNRAAAVAARLLQRPLWNLELEDIQAGIETLLLDRDVIGIEVRDAGGTVASRWTEPPPGPRSVLTFERPIRHNGKEIGTLRLALTTRRLRSRLLLGGILAVGGAGLAGLGLLAYVQVLFAQWVRSRRFARRLARQEVHTDLILDALGVSTYGARTDGSLLFGRGSLLESSGQPRRWGDWVLPEDRPEALRWFRTASAAGTISSTEYRVRRPDGEIRWVRDWVRRDGRRILGLLADVTEARRAREQQAALDRQMAQAQRMESLGRLASGLAHDFRNLLHVVRGHLELLERGLPPEQCLPPARDGLDQASRLLQSLLQLARTDIPRRKVPIGRVVEEAVALARPTLGPDVHLELHIAASPTVDLGVPEFQQAILNLLVNAKDAVGDRGRIEVVVSEEPDPEGRPWAVVTVRDDGPGIAPEVLPHVFQPFFTTKPPGIGTGLGLAMVERIVHLHGGAVEAASPPSGGAEFRIRLPVPEEPPTEGWTTE